MRDRRLKVFMLPEHLLEMMLHWRCHDRISLPDLDGLPPGYSIVSVHHDPYRKAWACVLRHPSFEEVPDGARLPEVDELLPMRWETFKNPARMKAALEAILANPQLMPDQVRALAVEALGDYYGPSPLAGAYRAFDAEVLRDAAVNSVIDNAKATATADGLRGLGRLGPPSGTLAVNIDPDGRALMAVLPVEAEYGLATPGDSDGLNDTQRFHRDYLRARGLDATALTPRPLPDGPDVVIDPEG